MLYTQLIASDIDVLQASDGVRLAAERLGFAPKDQACLAAAVCVLAEPFGGASAGRLELQVDHEPPALVIRWHQDVAESRDQPAVNGATPDLSLFEPVVDRVAVSRSNGNGRLVELVKRAPAGAPQARGGGDGSPAAAAAAAPSVGAGASEKDLAWARALRLQARGLLEAIAGAQRVHVEAASLAMAFAHDVKNPLSVIKTGAAILLKEAEESRTRAKLESILRATTRISQLVDEATDLAGLRAGRLRLERTPCEVRHLLEEAIARTRPYASQKGIALVAAGEIDGTRILCDGERVLRALVSLIMVMLKTTAEGSQIDLSANVEGPNLKIGAQVRTEDSFNGDPESLGLGRAFGVAAGREILRAHGGQLTIASPHDRMLEYVMTLPARDVTAR